MDFGGDLLSDGEPGLGVQVQALGVADEHVHDPVWVADAGYIGIEVLLSRGADHVDLGPKLSNRGVGAALLIGL